MGEKIGLRLKTIRLRGEISQGLVLPYHSLERFFVDWRVYFFSIGEVVKVEAIPFGLNIPILPPVQVIHRPNIPNPSLLSFPPLLITPNLLEPHLLLPLPPTLPKTHHSPVQPLLVLR